MNALRKIASGQVTRPSARLLDLVELMKPELTGLSVLSTLCGFYLGSAGSFDTVLFLFLALGTLLVGGGLGALNQYIERHYDAMMRRTERRPLPAGRMEPEQAFWFGSAILLAGITLLFLAANLITGVLALVISAVYLFVYTPMKRVSSWSTIIGGIPGALPPVMGWTAAGGELSTGALVLFAILFFWQIPHFYALAWMYRKDYARAGYEMLAVKDVDGSRTSRQAFVCILALIIASMGLSIIGLAGWRYSIIAIALGLLFLLYGFDFMRFTGLAKVHSPVKVNHFSRRLFFASLWYLPALMLSMIVDKL